MVVVPLSFGIWILARQQKGTLEEFCSGMDSWISVSYVLTVEFYSSMDSWISGFILLWYVITFMLDIQFS